MKVSKKYHIRKRGKGTGLLRKNPVFERGCKEDISGGLTVSRGEAGRGVYAYVPSRAMRDYYTRQGETLVRITPRREGVVIVDLTSEMDSLLSFAREELDDFAEGWWGMLSPRLILQISNVLVI